MVESNGGVAVGCRATYRLAVLGETEGQSVMRMLLASLSLFLFLGGCLTLKNKCVNAEVKDGGRFDLVLGIYASTSIQGPGSWRSSPTDLGPDDCQLVFRNRDVTPSP